MLDRSHVSKHNLLCSLSSSIASTLTDRLPFLQLNAYMYITSRELAQQTLPSKMTYVTYMPLPLRLSQTCNKQSLSMVMIWLLSVLMAQHTAESKVKGFGMTISREKMRLGPPMMRRCEYLSTKALTMRFEGTKWWPSMMFCDKIMRQLEPPRCRTLNPQTNNSNHLPASE